jgi:hypothetical protein
MGGGSEMSEDKKKIITCQDLKEFLGIDFKCCPTCHYDPYEREMGAFEKYTKFKDLQFSACCGFPKEELSDEQWKKLEKKLEEDKKK